MEVCGGHTHTIYRHGIEHLLPGRRRAGARARLPGVRDPDGPGRRRASRSPSSPASSSPSFGDMMRVPGRNGQPARGEGARRGRAIRLLAARRASASRVDNPDRQVVFFAVGFETTAPSTAVTLLRARDARRHATSACSATTSRSSRRSRPSSSRPTCGSTASSDPGTCRRWSAMRPYRFVPDAVRQADGDGRLRAARHPAGDRTCCCSQIREGRCEVENQYTRVVRHGGQHRRRCS